MSPANESRPAPPPDPESSARPARRWLWPAIVAIALVWATLLGTLAATRSNEPTLNRVQFRRADALALVEVTERTGGVTRTGGTVRAVVRHVVPGGRPGGDGSVPAELAEGTTVTIAGFPEEAATPGTVAAAPVRRVGRRWTVAEPPAGLPRMVYSLTNPGDWSDLKAAAASLSAGRDPYR